MRLPGEAGSRDNTSIAHYPKKKKSHLGFLSSFKGLRRTNDPAVLFSFFAFLEYTGLLCLFWYNANKATAVAGCWLVTAERDTNPKAFYLLTKSKTGKSGCFKVSPNTE